MDEILYSIFGLDAARLPAGARIAPEWTHAPSSWRVFLMVAVFAALIYGVFWLYRREVKACPLRVRLTLAVLRASVLALLAVILLGPVLAIFEHRTIEPSIVVVVDDSLSMDTRDQYATPEDRPAVVRQVASRTEQPEPQRAAVVEHVLADEGGKLVDQLSDQGHVIVRTFSSSKPLAVVRSKQAAEPDQDASPVAEASFTDRLLQTGVAVGAFGLLAALIVLAVAIVISKTWLVLGALAAMAVSLLIGGSCGAGILMRDQQPTSADQPQLVQDDGDQFAAQVGDEQPTDDAAQPESDDESDAEAGANPSSLAALSQLKPMTPTSNLYRQIVAALDHAASNQLAAIVLMSDGQWNEGENPVEAAKLARDRGIPIIAVGVGEATEPANLKIASVGARDSVWREDPFELRAVIQGEQLGDADIRVVLEKRRQGEESVQRVDERTFRLGANSPRREVLFTDRPADAGQFVYTVRAEPIEEIREADLGDNAKPVVVTVLSEKAKVLLLAGSPTWEYRAVRNLLQRDESIELSCWLQTNGSDTPQDGNRVLDRLPQTFEDRRFVDSASGKEVVAPGLNQFDVILMFDPDPAPTLNPQPFDTQWTEAIKTFVNRGGGLLYMAGPKFTPDFLTNLRSKDIAELLPVELADPKGFAARRVMQRFTNEWPLKLTSDGADHVVMRFTPDSALNRRIWSLAPGVFWSFPASRTKPGFLTLLEHSNRAYAGPDGGAPLMATGQAGAGRTVYMGFDSTWRWRHLGANSEFYDKFWIQMVRYLVEGKYLGEQKRGSVLVDRPTASLGQRVQIRATLTDLNFQPLVRDQYEAVLITHGNGGGERRTPITLKPVGGGSDSASARQYRGRYEASIIASRLGLHEVKVQIPGDEGPVTLQSRFLVETPRIEYENRMLNRQALQDIAEASGNGGMYVSLADYTAIPAAIDAQRLTDITEGRPQELWDTHFVLLLLVTLLTVEWAVRKAHRLL